MSAHKLTMKDRIEREIWKNPKNVSDYVIAEILGCSHVLVWKTRRERFLSKHRERIGRDGVMHRMPGRTLTPSARATIEKQVSELIKSISTWRHRSREGTAFLRRKQVQIERAFQKLDLTDG